MALWALVVFPMRTSQHRLPTEGHGLLINVLCFLFQVAPPPLQSLQCNTTIQGSLL